MWRRPALEYTHFDSGHRTYRPAERGMVSAQKFLRMMESGWLDGNLAYSEVFLRLFPGWSARRQCRDG